MPASKCPITSTGASIQVTPQAGKGSCFSFLMAQEQSTHPTMLQAKALNTTVKPGNSLILLIDDDPHVLESSAILLSLEETLVIRAAASPVAAYTILDEAIPDLIVTDYHLNHAETGVDIIQTIRKRANVNIPALLLSGDTSPSMDKVIENNKSVVVMRKPLEPDQLISTVHQLLSNGLHSEDGQ